MSGWPPVWAGWGQQQRQTSGQTACLKPRSVTIQREHVAQLTRQSARDVAVVTGRGLHITTTREVLTTINHEAIMTPHINSIPLRRLVAIATLVALTLGVTATAIANEPLPPIASQQDVTTLSGPNINAINIRSGPGTINPVVKTLAPGESLRIGCWKPGDAVTGPYGASTTWYQIDGAENQWISDAYVYTGQNYPTTMACLDDVPAAPQVAGEQELSSSERSLPKFTRNPSTYPLVLRVHYNQETAAEFEVAYKLVNHYEREDEYAGTDVIIDWEFFKNNQGLKEAFYSTEVDNKKPRVFAPGVGSKNDRDMTMALHSFSIYRTDDHCGVLYDYYDFGPEYWPWMLNATFGSASKFNVFAYGCFD